METQVLLDKAGDKVVAVVVTRLQAQAERMVRRSGGGLKRFNR